MLSQSRNGSRSTKREASSAIPSISSISSIPFILSIPSGLSRFFRTESISARLCPVSGWILSGESSHAGSKTKRRHGIIGCGRTRCGAASRNRSSQSRRSRSAVLADQCSSGLPVRFRPNSFSSASRYFKNRSGFHSSGTRI